VKMSRYGGARSPTKNYEFETCHAGTIIGPKGAGINSLKQMDGVTRVFLDTKTSTTSCFLKVQASSLSICEEVHAEIQRRISKKASLSLTAQFRKIFIEANENENEISLKLCDGEKDMPVIMKMNDHNSIYFLESFEASENVLVSSNSDAQVNKGFKTFSQDSIKKTFDDTLSSIEFSKNPSLELKFIPGKIVFLGSGRTQTEKIYRRGNGNVETSLKPLFITFLNPLFRDKLFDNMTKYKFEYLNKDDPEAFTTVHLYAGMEKKHFSVKLALDKNLLEFKEGKDDMRLSDEKKEAITRIFKATTVGEVLSGAQSVKIIYRKLTLMLHPDKNSHPGATEAFKKLQDAYNAINDGKSKSTPALKIESPQTDTKDLFFSSPKIESPQTDTKDKPPKVISVVTDKTRLCALTVLSDAVLDVRTSIVSYAKDPENLSQHVRDVLNKCWEERDEQGGICTPDGKTGIYIDCVKQVTAKHVWVKEITLSGGSFLLEVIVNEIREKITNQKNWKECIEVDLQIIIDKRNWKEVNAVDLTEEFLKMKKEWENICPAL